MKNKKPDVLVLNRGFIAIHIIEWKKAMSLIIQESARALDRDYVAYDLNDWFALSETDDSYPMIATVSRRIAVPEIIVLQKYDRLPQRDVKYSRQTLFQRDKYTCAYCGHVFERKELTVDHVIPRAQGGKTTWLNTVCACFPCNSKKADKTPEQAGMHLKHKPRKPSWISPLTHVKLDHMRPSWEKFSYRTITDEE